MLIRSQRIWSRCRCSATRGRRGAGVIALALSHALLWACGSDGITQPDSLRFAQVGQVRIVVESLVEAGASPQTGTLTEVLVWLSDGRWQLTERIALESIEGDATLRSGNAGPGGYASLITQVNDVEALKLFVEGLDPDVDPTCAPGRSRISVRLEDDLRNEEMEWIRCATGSLRTLSSVGAAPGAEARRVAVAAQLARDFSLGEGFTYSYTGSLPFRTLDRGEESNTLIEGPRAFRSLDAEPPEGWTDFWAAHSDGAALPEIDWVEEMVLVAAVGVVSEAGDIVEVRRVLQVESTTLVEYVRRVPGDFCSPAAVQHVPFHFVVAPRSVFDVTFSDLRIERVSCGA